MLANDSPPFCSLVLQVLANDPDADRLAVAVWLPAPPVSLAEAAACMPSSRAAGGVWRPLSGNEIGALLAHWMWTHRDVSSTKPAVRGPAWFGSRFPPLACVWCSVLREPEAWLGFEVGRANDDQSLRDYDCDDAN